MFKKAFKTLGYYSNIYRLIVSVYLKTKLSYRADFIISLFGILAKSFSGVLALFIMFATIPELSGWTLHELLFMYGLVTLSIVPIDLFFSNLWQLHTHIIEGSFIKYYLRPINIMFYYFAEIFDYKAFMQLFTSVALILYASGHISVEWSILKVLLMLLFCFSSSLIMLSVFILATSTGFWITNSTSIINFVSQFTRFAQYPLNIYNGFFRFLFTFIIPIGFISYYPATSLLKGNNLWVAFVSPLIGIIFFTVSAFVWNRGVKRFSGTGT